MRIPLSPRWFFTHKIQTHIRVAFMQMHKKNPFSIKSYLYWSNFIANFMSPFAMFLTFLFHFHYLKTNLLCVTFLARAYKHRHTQTGILNFYFILLSYVMWAHDTVRTELYEKVWHCIKDIFVMFTQHNVCERLPTLNL